MRITIHIGWLIGAFVFGATLSMAVYAWQLQQAWKRADTAVELLEQFNSITERANDTAEKANAQVRALLRWRLEHQEGHDGIDRGEQSAY